jgi:hypothetical protein
MGREVVDLGEVLAVYEPDAKPDAKPDLWISPASGVDASPRLVEAFARGEVTEGGLAEAGWRLIGTMGEIA